MRFLLTATHSTRSTDLERCSLNHFRQRFRNPARLKSPPPFASLPPAQGFDVYAGGVSIWLIDTEIGQAQRLQRIDPPGRVQHAIVTPEYIAVLGTTELQLRTPDGGQRVVSDPWMAGAHTVVANDQGLLLVACSASDAVLTIDPRAGQVIAATRLPERPFGRNYHLDRSDDLRSHYISNDLQIAHLNRASPDGDAVLVSTLIQGALGRILPDGSWQEIATGFVGCHGARRHPGRGLYFADSCAGHAVFLGPDGKISERIDFGCSWLHDVEIVGDSILIGAVADRNELAFFDLDAGAWLGTLDCSSLGQTVQFIHTTTHNGFPAGLFPSQPLDCRELAAPPVPPEHYAPAPFGLGKYDACESLSLPDGFLLSQWTNAFNARCGTHFEECLFLRTLTSSVKGKRIISIGSGMGFHEILFAACGADVTCYDTVPTNLSIIKRIANLKNLPLQTRIVTGIDSYVDTPGSCDLLYIYGSLMTMPEDEQRRLIARTLPSLKDGGELLLMLYTPGFAEETCRSASPQAFARHSDPSVGEQHCPWSDWHDDAKILRLTGGGYSIARRQLWNHGWFSWHGLRHGDAIGNPKPFFDLGQIGLDPGGISIPLSGFQPGASTLVPGPDHLRIETTANQFLYAAISSDFPTIVRDGLALLVDLEIVSGACSVGLLHVPSDAMMLSQAVRGSGRKKVVFPITAVSESGTMRLIISNFSESSPAPSIIVLYLASVIRFPLPSLPSGAPS